MSFFGPPAERIDPGEAVLEELARSRGFIRDLEAKIRDIEEQDLVWGRISEMREDRTGGQGGDYTLVREEMGGQMNAWWTMLAAERKHYATVAAHAVRSGIEERRVRLAERGLDILEAAFVAALTDIGLDPADTRVKEAIGSRLRQAIEAGEIIEGQVVGETRVAEPVYVGAATGGVRPVDF